MEVYDRIIVFNRTQSYDLPVVNCKLCFSSVVKLKGSVCKIEGDLEGSDYRSGIQHSSLFSSVYSLKKRKKEWWFHRGGVNCLYLQKD